MKCAACGYEDDDGLSFGLLRDIESGETIEVVTQNNPYTMMLYVCPKCGTVRTE